MVVKKKLSLGLGFLFFIILVLTVFCSYSIGKLSQEAGNILKDNYHSLVYSRNMSSALENQRTAISNIIFNQDEKQGRSDHHWQRFEQGRIVFEKNLAAEIKNITEIHETEYVEAIRRDYALFLRLCRQVRTGTGNHATYFHEFLPAFEQLRRSIDNIHDINMQAVVRKSGKTGQDAKRAIETMAAIGVFCLILAFAYFWYFPFYIANSISYLAEKMRQLLKKMGITMDSGAADEFLIILQSINLLENKFSDKNKE